MVFIKIWKNEGQQRVLPGVAAFNLSSDTTGVTALSLGVPSSLTGSAWLSFVSVDLTGVTDLSRGFEVCFENLEKQCNK